MWHELFDATSWIGERLAVGSLQGAVVIALAWAACRWIPRVPAALQAWVWWLVAMKLVFALLPLPAVPAAAAPVREAPCRRRQTRRGRVADVRCRYAAAGACPGSTSLNWLGLFASAWLLGIALHGLLLVRAAAAARGLVRRATPLCEWIWRRCHRWPPRSA